MQAPSVTSAKRWREPELWLVAALVAAVYLPQLTQLNLQGEETRRALVAVEMLRTGDWIVPRQQGEVYVSRPPLGSWLIAAAGLVRGDVDVTAVRLPTVLAVVLTSLLLYCASRNFLSTTGALAAAVAYPTMLQVLEIGRRAESEGLFTFFVSSSLIVWHWGQTQNGPKTATWVAGYALAACAGLTKGLPGPVYFVAPVFCFLLVERRWRELFRLPHLIGVACFLLLTAGWQVPYMLRAGRDAGLAIWFDQASDHLTQIEPNALLKHMGIFPLKLLASTLPWSPILVQLINPQFRAALRRDGAPLRFFAICLLMTFPSVWLTPHARCRYFMPLFPIISIWCGMVIEQCSRAGEATWMNRGWRQFLAGTGMAVFLIGLTVAACPIINRPWAYDVNDNFTKGLAFFAASIAVSGLLVGAAIGDVARASRRAVAGIAAFTGLAYCLTFVNGAVRNQPDIHYRVAAMFDRLPQNASLVSLGPIDHALVYFARRPIPLLEQPSTSNARPAVPAGIDFEYFCFERSAFRDEQVPFAWEKVGELNVSNNAAPHPDAAVVFGRRLGQMPLAAQQR